MKRISEDGSVPPQTSTSLTFSAPDTKNHRIFRVSAEFMRPFESLGKNALEYILKHFFGTFTPRKKIVHDSFQPCWLDERTIVVIGRKKVKRF